MPTIRALKIEKTTQGTGRDIGLALAKIVSPGDIVDFEGFSTITNSFADEFIWKFTEMHSKDDINTVSFLGETTLLHTLIKRAIARRVHNVTPRIKHSSIIREQIDFLSELSA